MGHVLKNLTDLSKRQNFEQEIKSQGLNCLVLTFGSVGIQRKEQSEMIRKRLKLRKF